MTCEKLSEDVKLEEQLPLEEAIDELVECMADVLKRLLLDRPEPLSDRKVPLKTPVMPSSLMSAPMDSQTSQEVILSTSTEVIPSTIQTTSHQGTSLISTINTAPLTDRISTIGSLAQVLKPRSFPTMKPRLQQASAAVSSIFPSSNLSSADLITATSSYDFDDLNCMTYAKSKLIDINWGSLKDHTIKHYMSTGKLKANRSSKLSQILITLQRIMVIR